FFCLNAHYRQVLNFSWEALEAAQRGFHHLQTAVRDIHEKALEGSIDEPESQWTKNLVLTTREEFLHAVNDDLSTPRALAIVFDVLKKIHKQQEELWPVDWAHIYRLLLDLDEVLGLKLANLKKEKIPVLIQKLTHKREMMRKEKKWGEADEIRKDLESHGYTVEDTPHGPVVKKL
ncbi:MAG: hypothetical protein Q7R79_05595, partial [bacterium]|nr:hypothetical protein [bacterium]